MTPDSELIVTLTLQGIDNLLGNLKLVEKPIQIKVKAQDCLKGEFLSEQYECTQCGVGTYLLYVTD